MVKADSPGPGGSLRTCVGCRARGERSQLLRVVVRDTGDGLVLQLDVRRRLPGRGAWLHARIECLDQAVRRKAFGRALRVSAAMDPGDLAAQISALAEMRSTTPEPSPTAAPADENRKRV